VATIVFSANQGDGLGVAVTNLALTGVPNNDMHVTIVKPDGTTLTGSWCSGSGCTFNLQDAPMSGVYSIVITPDGNAGTMSFTVTVSDDISSAPIAIDGGASTLAIGTPGQNGWMSFTNATAGQPVLLLFSGIATAPSGKSVVLTIYNPDGSTLATGGPTSAQSFNLTLMQTGTYMIYVDPTGSATASVTAQIIKNPNGPTLPSNGTAQTYSTTLSGENEIFTFSANQGDDLGLAVTNVVLTGVPNNDMQVTVQSPDGSTFTSAWCSGSGCNFSLTNLPITGDYSVKVSPDSGRGTLSFTATLRSLY
jgi:hypothetical protein